MSLVVLKKPPRKNAADRRRALREHLWPNSEALIWSRHKDHGFCSIPRTLPLIMTLINLLSPKKNGDASRVYHELWCRAFDEGFVEIGDEADHAYAAGFVSARGVRTWRERISLLVKLGFIKVQGKGAKKHAYVLFVHPHDVVESLRGQGQVPGAWYNSFAQRVQETGARMGGAMKSAKSKTGRSA